MTHRQAQAYLLARDAIRRVQRVSWLIGAPPAHRASPSDAGGSPRGS